MGQMLATRQSYATNSENRAHARTAGCVGLLMVSTSYDAATDAKTLDIKHRNVIIFGTRAIALMPSGVDLYIGRLPSS